MRQGDLVVRVQRNDLKKWELDDLRDRQLILTVVNVFAGGKVEVQWFSKDGVLNEDIFPPGALEEI